MRNPFDGPEDTKLNSTDGSPTKRSLKMRLHDNWAFLLVGGLLAAVFLYTLFT